MEYGPELSKEHEDKLALEMMDNYIDSHLSQYKGTEAIQLIGILVGLTVINNKNN